MRNVASYARCIAVIAAVLYAMICIGTIVVYMPVAVPASIIAFVSAGRSSNGIGSMRATGAPFVPRSGPSAPALGTRHMCQVTLGT